MQLDSILSDQLSSPTIQPSEPVLHTSTPSELDCNRTFEASFPPFFESIINDKLGRVCSSSSNTSSTLSNKLDNIKKISSSGSNKGVIENEGTTEACQQTLLLSTQNGALPLDHKTPTDLTRLQEQKQQLQQQPQPQQNEQRPHQQHLVLLKSCSRSSPDSSLTALSAEGSLLSHESSPESASSFSQRGADLTRREQERLLSEPQFPEDKDLELILKSPSLAQHPHIIYPTSPSTTTVDHGSPNEPASTGAVEEVRRADLGHVSQDRVPPQLPSHQPAAAPTGAPCARTHADNGVGESTINNNSYVSVDTCAFLFSAQSNIRTFSTSAPSSLNQTTNPKNASKATTVRPSATLHFDLRCDGDSVSDDMVDSLAIGAEKKRPTAAETDTSMLKKRKRAKSQDKTKSRISISAGTTTHLLRFLERRLGRSACAIPTNKTGPTSAGFPTMTEFVQGFDPSELVRSWSIPGARNVSRCSTTSQRPSRFHSGNDQDNNSHICKQQHTSVEHCHCRKRFFADAMELASPLNTNALAGDQYPGWIDSIKKRKIHQFATKWTSTLSPSPYLKLLTIRNFWDVMSSRMNLSWLDEERIQGEPRDQPAEGWSGEMPAIGNHCASKEIASARREHDKRLSLVKQGEDGRTVRQYTCPTQFLKGLWEEELREQRVKQMIPDTVRRPPRNRIFNARPIAVTTKPPKPCLPSLLTPSLSTRSEINTGTSTDASDSSTSMGSEEGGEVAVKTSSPQPALAELDLMLKKKHRATAILRSHAIAEGSDMSDYKPWKDGTVVPHRGSLCSLKDLRSHIMDPWPAEETRSRDECSRILHRMREQLNVVINLQIHLRSMIKTAPTQLSFLLSIRHPAQVSIELLLALYGPHFTQTSNFRAIEQLLWGSHGHSQPQPQADTSGSLLHV
ncbi:unnamed protein product [Mortierella alpina]